MNIRYVFPPAASDDSHERTFEEIDRATEKTVRLQRALQREKNDVKNLWDNILGQYFGTLQDMHLLPPFYFGTVFCDIARFDVSISPSKSCRAITCIRRIITGPEQSRHVLHSRPPNFAKTPNS